MDHHFGIERSLLIPELFDLDVVSYELSGPAVLMPLLDAERAAIPSASDKRLFEYSSGRMCARRSLSAFGIDGIPVLPGPKREPLWPPGFVGSITHTKGYCAAVVASSRGLNGIGIDCELMGRVSIEMERLICTPGEQARLSEDPPRERERISTLLFSAKEAFYKCQYNFTKTWLGFRDVECRIEGDQFFIHLCDPGKVVSLADTVFAGRFVVSGGFVLTGIAFES